jgi:hypothetical protein
VLGDVIGVQLSAKSSLGGRYRRTPQPCIRLNTLLGEVVITPLAPDQLKLMQCVDQIEARRKQADSAPSEQSSGDSRRRATTRIK